MKEVKNCIKEIYEKVGQLKMIEPDFTWENLLGDYGEYIAINSFNLIKSPNTTKGYDALDSCGKTVQIKTVKTGKDIKFKDEAIDLLLVIKVYATADWEILYYGDFNEVKKFCSFSKYSNRYVVSLSKIKSLQNED
jgi:hypothetical protein